MRQLTSLDAQFLAVESSSTYGHVAGLGIYDPSTAPGGRLELKDLRRNIRERLHLLPPFRWRLVQVPFGLDLPYWVDDPDFDLDFHVRHMAIPAPGDDDQLATQVARIIGRPMDRSRPLWEVYVLEGLAGDDFAVLMKIHHAITDGVGAVTVLMAVIGGLPLVGVVGVITVLAVVHYWTWGRSLGRRAQEEQARHFREQLEIDQDHLSEVERPRHY